MDDNNHKEKLMLKAQGKVQHQQMNLGLTESSLFGDRESNNNPVFVVNYYSQQIGERPQYPNTQTGNLQQGDSQLIQKPSKQKKKKRNNKAETMLKNYYANDLIDCIAKERISYEVASHQINMPLDILIELSKGNVGRVSLYELLSAITKFGYQARICMLPTDHRFPGVVVPDR